MTIMIKFICLIFWGISLVLVRGFKFIYEYIDKKIEKINKDIEALKKINGSSGGNVDNSGLSKEVDDLKKKIESIINSGKSSGSSVSASDFNKIITGIKSEIGRYGDEIRDAKTAASNAETAASHAESQSKSAVDAAAENKKYYHSMIANIKAKNKSIGSTIAKLSGQVSTVNSEFGGIKSRLSTLDLLGSQRANELKVQRKDIKNLKKGLDDLAKYIYQHH